MKIKVLNMKPGYTVEFYGYMKFNDVSVGEIYVVRDENGKILEMIHGRYDEMNEKKNV